jgi:hypothetical protein
MRGGLVIEIDSQVLRAALIENDLFGSAMLPHRTRRDLGRRRSVQTSTEIIVRNQYAGIWAGHRDLEHLRASFIDAVVDAP